MNNKDSEKIDQLYRCRIFKINQVMENTIEYNKNNLSCASCIFTKTLNRVRLKDVVKILIRNKRLLST